MTALLHDSLYGFVKLQNERTNVHTKHSIEPTYRRALKSRGYSPKPAFLSFLGSLWIPRHESLC